MRFPRLRLSRLLVLASFVALAVPLSGTLIWFGSGYTGSWAGDGEQGRNPFDHRSEDGRRRPPAVFHGTPDCIGAGCGSGGWSLRSGSMDPALDDSGDIDDIGDFGADAVPGKVFATGISRQALMLANGSGWHPGAFRNPGGHGSSPGSSGSSDSSGSSGLSGPGGTGDGAGGDDGANPYVPPDDPDDSHSGPGNGGEEEPVVPPDVNDPGDGAGNGGPAGGNDDSGQLPPPENPGSQPGEKEGPGQETGSEDPAPGEETGPGTEPGQKEDPGHGPGEDSDTGSGPGIDPGEDSGGTPDRCIYQGECDGDDFPGAPGDPAGAVPVPATLGLFVAGLLILVRRLRVAA